MTIPTWLLVVPLLVAVVVLWFWLIAKLLAWVLRPLDRKIARLESRNQNPPNPRSAG